MKPITITDATIAKLESAGFSRWTKGRFDRLYINPTTYGVTYTRYASGKVSGGEFAGETFGAYEARNFESTKVYIDLTDGTLHVTTRTDYEREITAAVENIIADALATATTDTDEDTTTTTTDTDESIEIETTDGATNTRTAAECIDDLGMSVEAVYKLVAIPADMRANGVTRITWLRGTETVAEVRVA